MCSGSVEQLNHAGRRASVGRCGRPASCRAPARRTAIGPAVSAVFALAVMARLERERLVLHRGERGGCNTEFIHAGRVAREDKALARGDAAQAAQDERQPRGDGGRHLPGLGLPVQAGQYHLHAVQRGT